MKFKFYPVISLMFALFLLIPHQATAAVPKLLTYQGILKDSPGNFLTGTYSMTFRIYSAATGGSSLWSETQSSVSASSGRFSVQLGSVTVLNLAFGQDYWLSIQVGSDAEMTPRQKLTSVGYALMAENVVNSFTQAQHDALSHKNIEGVKANTANIAKTNFKVDAITLASANSMGDLVVDSFNDATGIHAASSSNYTWRNSPNYDVVATSNGGIDSNTVLMLHTNGTNGSTTFTDSSDTPLTVTANGNAQITTGQSKFGGASGLFDGSGDYLTIPSNSVFDFGTGDFTIDFCFRWNTSPSGGLIYFDNGGYSSGVRIGMDSTSVIGVYVAGTAFSFSSSLSQNVWYHMALVRSGSNLKMFIDGTQVGSTQTNSSNVTGLTSGVTIGARIDGTSAFNGWIDELRVSKGVARWTSNFTPPSSEYAGSSGAQGTVISTAYSEPAAPTEAMVIADETLGTGSITYYVSRDNGTTWTQCTKETVTSISSQPSGTQLKWKAVINGNAELNAIAVAV